MGTTDPVRLVRDARDAVERVNNAFLDDGARLSAPAVSATVQALKELVERLPQALDQAAAVIELLGARERVVMDTGQDAEAFTAEVAAQLRAAATSSEQLAKELAAPASTLFHMGGRTGDCGRAGWPVDLSGAWARGPTPSPGPGRRGPTGNPCPVPTASGSRSIPVGGEAAVWTTRGGSPSGCSP
ncbi:hypothetical protein ACQKM2_35840 [Streptomyces sp. NPDC004126]|uniref:hypothetical protein n=1 Tax=Streptomyces sp. NPDC004126 TaxID=3390695 RepID=UPI003D074D5B